MKKADIYVPLDARNSANRVVYPVARKQIAALVKAVGRCGWKANVLNPDKPITSVAEGIRVARKATGDRFINFLAGWAYPDFTVSPMWQLDARTPKLLLGSIIPDFPGAVALLAAAGGLSQVGVKTTRMFVEDWDNIDSFIDPLDSFLNSGKYAPRLPKAITVKVSARDRAKAKKLKRDLSGMIYGCVGPRSMEMWNKISDADFLRYFGVVRESFDGLRLAKMAEKVPAKRARAAVKFLEKKGMELKLGKDPKRFLTRDMLIFQMKVYYALLDLKEEFGLDFVGVQDQLDWIMHYPATDLVLSLLNNRLRPDGDGETVVAATEADDGAAITMQIMKLLSGGEPVGFNDLRYWKDGIYWFVNSGALAPFFAKGSHRSLKGSWSERQTPMYFKHGGGTGSVVVRKPGVVTWARVGYRDHKPYLCAGRGVTDVPTRKQWLERTERCSRDWPQWYIRLCGNIEWKINSNHPMAVFGDCLSQLKAVAHELGIGFECYDHRRP